MQNFSSLAGLDITEKFDLIYFFRVAGWVAGWKSGIKANISLSLS